MTNLIQIVEGTYEDQYGFEHKCFEIVDRVKVSITAQYKETQGWGDDPIQNRIWEGEDGRLWINYVATDYGAPSTWSAVDDENKWVEDRGAKTWGRVPLITKQGVK